MFLSQHRWQRGRALLGIGMIRKLYDAHDAARNEGGLVDAVKGKALAVDVAAEAWCRSCKR
jgi:hypothetical protein